MKAAVKPVVKGIPTGLILNQELRTVDFFVVCLAKGDIVFLGFPQTGIIYNPICCAFHALYGNHDKVECDSINCKFSKHICTGAGQQPHCICRQVGQQKLVQNGSQ
jgi:hypothetical protein